MYIWSQLHSVAKWLNLNRRTAFGLQKKPIINGLGFMDEHLNNIHIFFKSLHDTNMQASILIVAVFIVYKIEGLLLFKCNCTLGAQSTQPIHTSWCNLIKPEEKKNTYSIVIHNCQKWISQKMYSSSVSIAFTTLDTDCHLTKRYKDKQKSIYNHICLVWKRQILFFPKCFIRTPGWQAALFQTALPSQWPWLPWQLKASTGTSSLRVFAD